MDSRKKKPEGYIVTAPFYEIIYYDETATNVISHDYAIGREQRDDLLAFYDSKYEDTPHVCVALLIPRREN